MGNPAKLSMQPRHIKAQMNVQNTIPYMLGPIVIYCCRGNAYFYIGNIIKLSLPPSDFVDAAPAQPAFNSIASSVGKMKGIRMSTLKCW